KLQGPLLAPLDEALPATFDVRCADCHNASPAGPKVAFDAAPPPLGRCSHCHRAHAPFDDDEDERSERSVRDASLPRTAPPAPYLHNGAVPTLRALLEPAAKRPVIFPLGRAGFVVDTRLAGNRNFGHEFGTRLSAREKADLIAFLESL